MVADDGTGSSDQVTIPVEADFVYVYSTADGMYDIDIKSTRCHDNAYAQCTLKSD